MQVDPDANGSDGAVIHQSTAGVSGDGGNDGNSGNGGYGGSSSKRRSHSVEGDKQSDHAISSDMFGDSRQPGGYTA